MKVQKLCYFIEIYFYSFLVFLKYILGGSQLFSVALSRKVRKSINANTEDSCQKKKKKVTSYTPGAFALNKILDFLVSAEERDKATLKTC